MDIYDIKVNQRKSSHSIKYLMHVLVPSHAEILLELTQKEVGTSSRKGHAAWISSGLKIQEMQ